MKILLLSKDNEIINAVERYTGDAGDYLTAVADAQHAKDKLASHDFDSVLFDCSIRPTELISLAAEISDILAETVVLLLGPLDHEQRKQLERRLSAHYSIDKPLRGKVFHETMRRVTMRATIVRKAGLIGRSTVMEEIIQTIMQIASTPISVLISGESGTGKEVIARAIHSISLRADKPFLAVNCAALAEGVLESELFGHEKGSFTGAALRRHGVFEKVNKGTIFLDEIGEIPHSTQIRLLRVLEEREIMRVGGTEIIPVDVRIITASNRSLKELVDEGKFRRDLYYRIKVLEINAPPLRKRPEDIPLLIDRLAKQYAADNHLQLRHFNDEVKVFLTRYRWSGNVRELRNFIESCLALTNVSPIRINDIPEHLLSDLSSESALPMVPEKTSERAERELIYRTLIDMKNDITEIKSLLLSQGYAMHDIEAQRTMEVVPIENNSDQTLEDIERTAIIETLEHTNGNRRKTAEMLGIGERTLYRKLKQYGIR